MSTSQESEARTRMFSRVTGPFLVVVAVAAAMRTSELRTLVAEYSTDHLWTWVTGAFTLLSGLVVVGLHQYWRSPAAIIVSTLGWLTAVKGLLLLAFPGVSKSITDTAVLDGANWTRVAYIVFAILGLYLTYVGWAITPGRSAPQAVGSTSDLPHAA